MYIQDPHLSASFAWIDDVVLVQRRLWIGSWRVHGRTLGAVGGGEAARGSDADGSASNGVARRGVCGRRRWTGTSSRPKSASSRCLLWAQRRFTASHRHPKRSRKHPPQGSPIEFNLYLVKALRTVEHTPPRPTLYSPLADGTHGQMHTLGVSYTQHARRGLLRRCCTALARRAEAARQASPYGP